MKKILALVFLTTLFFCVKGQNEGFCPEENTTIYFTFQQPARYSISTTPSNLKGVTVVQNITSTASSPYTCYAIIKFADQKGPHHFKIYDHSEHMLLSNAYEYKRVNTLEGNKPKWINPPNFTIHPFGEWDDTFDLTSVGAICKTAPFTYTVPEVKYKDSDGNTYGTYTMTLYEWLMPKGFKIGNQISDGTNAITTVSPTATIIPDPVSWGEIKVRATNNCSPYVLKRTDWYRIKLLHRSEMRLAVNGANTISIACEDVALRTFTLENGIIACASGYSWTIGSNWLLENGNPAPATLTTTLPTLKLKPVGTAAPGNIKVRLIVNGQLNVNEMTCNVNFINNPPPPFSISGDNSICSGQKTYTVVSSNSNTTWNLSSQPSGVVSYTTNGNSITISRVQNRSGIITLSSTIKNACGAQRVSAPKIISIGTPNSPSLYAFWDDIPKIRVIAAEVPGARYRWSLNDVFIYETTDYNTSIPSYAAWNSCNTVYDVGLDLVTSCGTSTVLQRKYYRIGIPPCDGTGHRKSSDSPIKINDSEKNIIFKPNEIRYKIAPNPVTTSLEIYANTQYNQLIKDVVILDQLGASRKKISMGKGVKSTKINVQDLAKGLYFVRIYDGKNWSVHQVMIGK